MEAAWVEVNFCFEGIARTSMLWLCPLSNTAPGCAWRWVLGAAVGWRGGMGCDVEPEVLLLPHHRWAPVYHCSVCDGDAGIHLALNSRASLWMQAGLREQLLLETWDTLTSY